MNKQTIISSKWVKTKLLARSALLAAHMPETLQLSAGSLEGVLKRHEMIYVKPDSGSCGIGVMRIDFTKGKWIVQEGAESFSFNSYRKMFKWLSERIKGEAYLAQKGVHVLRHRGRPFDFRVMIQKGEAGWKVTGMAARVAHPLRVVTNGSQGGSIYGAESLLKRAAGSRKATQLIEKFNRLALETAHQFGNTYPRMSELGLDIAVDREYRPWILEVNTKPDPCPFTKLDDPSMIREMVKYARGYGRTFNLSCNKAKKGRA